MTDTDGETHTYRQNAGVCTRIKNALILSRQNTCPLLLRERETDRDSDRAKEREGRGVRHTHTEYSNSKTLILKDSSVRYIWT